MLVAAFVALSNNTTWSGHFQAERVAGFLHDVVEAFLWSFLLLLFAASLRSRTRSWTAGQGGRTAPSQPSFAPLPWTDRWIRDWRHAESQLIGGAVEAPENGLPVRCRHGVPV